MTDKYFQNFRSKVKVVGRRKVKNVIWPYLGVRMVVEIRDWCQNVGEYNTYNFCIWHFWSMRYSFQDRPVSKFGPPI